MRRTQKSSGSFRSRHSNGIEVFGPYCWLCGMGSYWEHHPLHQQQRARRCKSDGSAIPRWLAGETEVVSQQQLWSHIQTLVKLVERLIDESHKAPVQCWCGAFLYQNSFPSTCGTEQLRPQHGLDKEPGRDNHGLNLPVAEWWKGLSNVQQNKQVEHKSNRREKAGESKDFKQQWCSSNMLCRRFLRHGRCKYGHACHFTHHSEDWGGETKSHRVEEFIAADANTSEELVGGGEGKEKNENKIYGSCNEKKQEDADSMHAVQGTDNTRASAIAIADTGEDLHAVPSNEIVEVEVSHTAPMYASFTCVPASSGDSIGDVFFLLNARSGCRHDTCHLQWETSGGTEVIGGLPQQAKSLSNCEKRKCCHLLCPLGRFAASKLVGQRGFRIQPQNVVLRRQWSRCAIFMCSYCEKILRGDRGQYSQARRGGYLSLIEEVIRMQHEEEQVRALRP